MECRGGSVAFFFNFPLTSSALFAPCSFSGNVFPAYGSTGKKIRKICRLNLLLEESIILILKYILYF